ncbi:AfsR/SARP family transcriptional regulator [Frankia sp. Cpl3]|uniref:AfsR/SARP family transcriptional regulator n=1 Tax=Parafrankia colletiae TaxID=573497 RepID=UPI000A031D5C|nr:AfsR/SARP family transcriptional regulator [Parafrankia colletiae]MCK9900245.1 AfsR/SARP family transcriptional regulator [Frankia sp. Cpl3]
MRYELLGPLRVSNRRESHLLSAPKMEITLAVLLVGAGRITTRDTLVRELWGERPPRRAANVIQVYISRLRKFLAAAGADPARAIVTKPTGYLLWLDGASYDVVEFQEAMRDGRAHRAAGRYEAALAAAELALSLVRGSVVESEARGPVLTAFAVWAEEELLAALELSVEARTMLGQHREVISLLGRLITQYPLRESLYSQLMLVLYRSGRRAEALAVYRDARRVLRAELGLEPCRSLRRLHQAILTSDRLLDTSDRLLDTSDRLLDTSDRLLDTAGRLLDLPTAS